MATSHDSKDYMELKESVVNQKRQKKLEPSDLYKLASLLARWKPTDKLPVCLLCSDVSKQPSQLGHIFPHSVLKEAGHDECFDFIRGTKIGKSKMGYHLFCRDCEKIFKQGEDSFNPLFFKQLFKNPENKIVVQATQDLNGKNFPWLYYTLISIVWRSLCVIPECGNFIEVLECLREYLLNREASEETLDTKVKLFLFAPNSEINEKLSKDSPVFLRYFYNMFHAFVFDRDEYYPTEPNAYMGWVFCGPLHVVMIYSKENFKAFASNETDFNEWKVKSMLTTKTGEFIIEDQGSRFFPVYFYDGIVRWGSELLSSTTRLPSKGSDSASSSHDLQAVDLFLLPKDVSYDKTNDEFALSSKIYKERSKMDVGQYSRTLTFVKAKRGNAKILFVAVKGGLQNGGVVAVGLEYNDDGAVDYMKGVNIPKQVNKDLSTPQFKQDIETLIKDLDLQI